MSLPPAVSDGINEGIVCRSFQSAQSVRSIERSSFSAAAIWVRIVTCVTGLAEGYDLASISGVLVLIRAEIPMSVVQVGLLVGALYFTMALGAPFGGILADALGRKPALTVTYVLLVVGTLYMSLAADYTSLMVGRLVMGLGIGAGFTVVTTYTSEVSPKTLRGQFVCLEDLFIVVGSTLGYIASFVMAGAKNDWRWITGAGVPPALLALFLLFLMQLPESPRWNMLRGEKDRALTDLVSLVGEREASRMIQQWEQQDVKSASWTRVLCPSGHWRRRALIVGFGVLIAAMFTGMAAVSVYMPMILVDGDHVQKTQAFFLTSSIGGLRVVALSVAVFCMLDTIGRKPLMLVSLGGCGVACLAMSILCHLEVAVTPKAVALLIYSVAFSIGMGPVPYVYCAEIFPTDVRSKSVGIGMFVARLWTGILTCCFPLVQEALGLSACFLGLAVLCCASFTFVACFAPETKQTSLEEMQGVFKQPGEA